MCVINRISSEPPSHRECAEFAVKACPFLLRPRMKRLPDDGVETVSPGGIMLDRNPGCMALYQVGGSERRSGYRPYRTGDGWLIRMDEPARVDWWAEGRIATRGEIMASINSGYPFLESVAAKDGNEALIELSRLRDIAMRYVPAA